MAKKLTFVLYAQYLFNMTVDKFSWKVYLILTVILAVLGANSFLTVWAIDEGNIDGNHFIADLFVKTFYIFSFPITSIVNYHYFLRHVLESVILESMLYALILERIISVFKKRGSDLKVL